MEFGYGDWKSEFKHRRKAPEDNNSNKSQWSRNDDTVRHSRGAVPDTRVRRTRNMTSTPSNHNHAAAKLFIIVVAVAGGASFLSILARGKQQQEIDQKNAMVPWRRSVQSKCRRFVNSLRSQEDWSNESVLKQKQQVDHWAMRQVQFPETAANLPLVASLQQDEPCRYTFLDWRTDDEEEALAAWVELALDVCTPLWQKVQPYLPWVDPRMSRPRMNLATLQVSTNGSNSGSNHVSSSTVSPLRRYLHDWLWKPDVPRHVPRVYPEDICILMGVDEGGENVLQNLKRLERFVAGILPPLFRLFRIVERGIDSPHLARERNVENGEKQAEILAKLLTDIIVAESPPSTQSRRQGAETSDGFLLIRTKLDEIGSRALNHPSTLQILCKYCQLGNSVTVLLEQGTDPNQGGSALSTLEECGVQFVNLADY